MKNTKLILGILTALLVVPVAYALADNVTVSENVTLVLPSDDSSYTLKSSSGFNTMSLSGGDMTFTGGGGASVDITSGDRKNLANSRNISVTCGSNESQLTIPAQNGDTVVTPSGTCGSSSGTSSGGGGSGGSGGGGGGGGTFTQAPTPAASTVSKVTDLKQQIASIQAAIQAKLAQAGVSISTAISRNLAVGDRNDDVKKLQVLLATDRDVYPDGLASGYFGPATARAVRAFQKKYGLPTVGAVGPQTRAKIAEVFGTASTEAPAPPVSSQATEQAASVSAVAVGVPSRILNPGERNDQVRLLQEALARDKDIYPEGTVSGFYGPATTRAVQQFQMKYGVITSITDQGSGRYGPKTKVKFEEIFGGLGST
ncbi:MAG: peptidoglycan-binding protein, partial [Armatimonadota bacterium]|nr:peptidoglycan-binding protein [Armatimonadota bacterium]